VLTRGDRTPLVFPKIEITVGNGEMCDVRLPRCAAEVHCVIALTKEGYVVEDLGSPAGTLVGRKRIERSYVNPGEIIRVGGDKLILLPL